MNKTLAVDYRIYKNSINALINLDYKIIKIPEIRYLDKPVSSHADMVISKTDKHLFIDSSINDLFTYFDNVKIIDREVPIANKLQYPKDISMNCAYLGNKLICNYKFTEKAILDYADENGIKIIDVKQGYAKCSVCIVDDNSIITEDESIYNKAKEYGIDVLKIEYGGVLLDGYDYGFIGGCCGLIEQNVLAFNGCVEKHPEYSKIFKFCKQKNVELLSLCDKPLYDIGSIIRIV